MVTEAGGSPALHVASLTTHIGAGEDYAGDNFSVLYYAPSKEKEDI